MATQQRARNSLQAANERPILCNLLTCHSKFMFQCIVDQEGPEKEEEEQYEIEEDGENDSSLPDTNDELEESASYQNYYQDQEGALNQAKQQKALLYRTQHN